MRVVCDSCGATYKIPDTKLVKDVNRATCRKCGHRMLIRKPDGSAPAASGYPLAPTEEERTVIASASDLERRAREHLAAAQAATGTRLGARPPQQEEDPTIVKTLASVQSGGAGISVGRARTNEVPPAPARIQRHPPEEPPTTMGPTIERMPERHVSQSLGSAHPVSQAPRVEGAPGFDANADARRSVGRQAVVMDQVMRPPVPVAPDPRSLPPHSPFGQQANGGAGGAMPATPVAAPPKRSSMSGLIVAVVLLVVLSTIVAAAYVWRRTPVEMATERVDKVTTEEPAAEAAPAEAAPNEPPTEEPAADAAPTEPEAAEVAEAAPPPVAAPEARPEPPKSTSRTTSSSSSKSSSRSSGSSSKPTPSAPASNAIEIPDAPAATAKTTAPKTTTKPPAPDVSDADLLGDPAPAKSTAKTIAPPPVPAAEPAAEVLDTLPLTVLDTIVRNNKNIKRCFFNEQQKTGVLPSVSVRMKIETSGSVSSASVAEPAAQQGTDLDACLASAFKGLQFPAFKTPMGAVTYPFKF